jgi:hypothetical protein
MMGQGGMMGPGGMWMPPGGNMGFPGGQANQSLTLGQAELLLENQLKATNNPNLKLGKITEEDGHYVGEITTKDGSLVDKILVDKNTGWMKSVY